MRGAEANPVLSQGGIREGERIHSNGQLAEDDTGKYAIDPVELAERK